MTAEDLKKALHLARTVLESDDLSEYDEPFRSRISEARAKDVKFQNTVLLARAVMYLTRAS